MSASLASENMQGCSLLEELPRELVWIIIEYAAESISELRLVRIFIKLASYASLASWLGVAGL